MKKTRNLRDVIISVQRIQNEMLFSFKGRRSSTDQLVMHEEPLYCLPGSTINQNNTEQNEPFYYEIEESQPHGMKNHNVHEELQPDEEPHVYGTFNEPHQAATFNDPRGYSNTMYDSVGDTSKQSR